MQPTDYTRLIGRITSLRAVSRKTENDKARLRVLKKERRSLRQLRRIVRLFLV